jgi:hypothetical protein
VLCVCGLNFQLSLVSLICLPPSSSQPGPQVHGNESITSGEVIATIEVSSRYPKRLCHSFFGLNCVSFLPDNDLTMKINMQETGSRKAHLIEKKK